SVLHFPAFSFASWGKIITMRYLLYSLLLVGSLACEQATKPETVNTKKAEMARAAWRQVPTTNEPTARHEAAFVAVGDKCYLLGGRRVNPVDIYDPASKTWTAGDSSPVEIHHFQPVVYQDEIYLLGAMTGGYPGEDPLPEIHIYNPEKDEWRTGATIPEDRRRGGAGAVLHDGKIYLVCGIQDGHRGGHVAWLDSYDPATDTWERLPDAPRPRDHFQAVVHDNKLYALAGRTTIAAQGPFANTIGEVDVYDIATQEWSTLTDTLPTLRAGNAAIALEEEILVLGGESKDQRLAHNEVEALAIATGRWRALDTLTKGRHGTGVVALNGQLIMASGCGNHGGRPELADVIARTLE
ncbi:MAG: galactose oxidase, partial [Bacteroidota bacterium]